jgi:hypothetical protein
VKLLTFLGTGNYYETTYLWQDNECNALYAPVASISFLKPSKLIAFLTEEAEEKVFPAFKKALPPDLPVEPCPVPLGKDEPELWDIFTALLEVVDEGDEIAFDITHGLRSFPYLSLLVAAYLRAMMNVRIRAVLYGAFEVRDTTVTPNRAPMFDLSPMLTLLEWAAATDRFNRTGDSRYLSSLLREQQKSLATRWQKQPEKLRRLSALGNLASGMDKITQALRLIRPHDAIEMAAGLPEYAEKAKPVLAEAASALPFSMLLDKMNAAYAPLGLRESVQNQKQALEKERLMIRWYAEREQWVQAAALAREWLVSWVMAHLGIGPETSSTERHRVEEFVNSEAEAYLQAKKAERSFTPLFLRDIPEVETLLSLWKSFTDVRNDILHAGMRDDPGRPESLIKQIRSALAQIEALPLP